MKNEEKKNMIKQKLGQIGLQIYRIKNNITETPPKNIKWKVNEQCNKEFTFFTFL